MCDPGLDAAWDTGIAELVSARCGACHGNPTRTVLDGGAVPPADFRLDSYDDELGAGPDGGVRLGASSMAEPALARALDPDAPMPPPPLERLTADELARLMAWVCAGAPQGGPTDGGGVDAGAKTPDAGPCLAPAAVTLTALQATVFTPRCANRFCHAGARPAEGLSLVAGQSWAMTVNRPSNQATSLLRVAPFDPTGSYLMLKVLGQYRLVDGGSGNPMPPGLPLSISQRAQIHDWICRGAPDD